MLESGEERRLEERVEGDWRDERLPWRLVEPLALAAAAAAAALRFFCSRRTATAGMALIMITRVAETLKKKTSLAIQGTLKNIAIFAIKSYLKYLKSSN